MIFICFAVSEIFQYNSKIDHFDQNYRKNAIPLVTIAIINFNKEKYIEKAI